MICFVKLCIKEFGLEKSEDDPPEEESSIKLLGENLEDESSSDFPDNKSEVNVDLDSPAEDLEEEFSGEDPNPALKLSTEFLDHDPFPQKNPANIKKKTPHISLPSWSDSDDEKTPHKPLPSWCDSDEDLQIIEVK